MATPFAEILRAVVERTPGAVGGAFAALGLIVVTYMINRSPYVTLVNVVRAQPVQFSHEHHVRGLGIDCRYCHTSVETSSFAGVPSVTMAAT